MCRHNLQFHIKEFFWVCVAFLKSLGNCCLESTLKEYYGCKKKNTETQIPCTILIQSLLLYSPLLIIFPTGKWEGWIKFWGRLRTVQWKRLCLVISAYGGGVYTERKNGLLFQAVEYRIVKCGIAAVEWVLWDFILSLPPAQNSYVIFFKVFTRRLFTNVSSLLREAF